MKKIIIILMFLPAILYGQVTPDDQNQKFISEVGEEVQCFTDRNLYLSGEEIWFSAFILINGQFSDESLSKVLFVELFEASGRNISKGKYAIIKNMCSGSFQIPDETLSGVYFLRAYTQYMRNLPAESFATIPVTIVNTEITLPAKGKEDPAKTFIPEFRNENVVIKPSNSIYGNREKATIDISWPFKDQGSVSVAVVRRGTMDKNGIFNMSTGRTNTSSPEDSVFWIPDIRGINLSGFVREKATGLPVEGETVFLSSFGNNNNLLHMVKSQPNGAFIFSLNYLDGVRDVFVSIDPVANTNREVLINNDFSRKFQTLPEIPFKVDTTFNGLLTRMYVSQQSRKAFALLTFPPDNNRQADNLPDTYDVSVNLDDYIELSSLEEVFYEIVPPVAVKTEQGKKHLTVANYQTQHVATADLILLDGVPVFNVNELLKIPAVNIQRIDVINRPYYLGDNLLNSIISLKTKTGDFGGYNFPPESIFLEYQTMSGVPDFNLPDYSKESKKQSTIPDFRNLMFWVPDYNPLENTEKLEFFTSDDKGVYDIYVRGVLENGEIVYGTSSFEIR